MSYSNQPNIERKNCVWTTSRLLEMCIVPHVETKSVFTFQPIKRLVSTTVKSAKPAAMFSIFLLRTKNRQKCCLAATGHIVLQERRVATTRKKNHLHFWKKISVNHGHPHQRRRNRVQMWNKRIRFLLADQLSHTFNFQINFFNLNLQSTSQILSTYTKSSWSSQSPTTESSGLSILDSTLLLLQ